MPDSDSPWLCPYVQRLFIIFSRPSSQMSGLLIFALSRFHVFLRSYVVSSSFLTHFFALCSRLARSVHLFKACGHDCRLLPRHSDAVGNFLPSFCSFSPFTRSFVSSRVHVSSFSFYTRTHVPMCSFFLADRRSIPYNRLGGM